MAMFPIDILSEGQNDPLPRDLSVKQVRLGIATFTVAIPSM